MRRKPLVALLTLLALLSGCSRGHGALIAVTTAPLPPLLPAGAAFVDLAGVDDISVDGSCSLPRTLRPYQGEHEPVPGGQLARIHDRGRLIVGLDQGTYPFSYRDTITGELKGFDVALAKELAKSVLGDADRVDFRIISSAGRAPALDQGLVDIVVKTMSITCERAKEVAFSAPYFETAQRVMAVKNEDAPNGARKFLTESRVCASRGSTSIARFHHFFPSAQILGTTTWADCLVALQQGSADAITSDTSILDGFYGQDQNLYTVDGLNLGQEVYGVGMRKGEDELVRVVNKVIARVLADGTWQRLCQDNLVRTPCSNVPAQAVYADETKHD